MVRINPTQRRNRKASWLQSYICFSIVFIVILHLTLLRNSINDTRSNTIDRPLLRPPSGGMVRNNNVPNNIESDSNQQLSCPYMSLSDLTHDERYPSQGPRHMVTPPVGGTVTLVCCQTTKGPWSIAVHDAWAPLGATRFLDMVTSGYFTTKVPLFRCIHNFLCQFGLSSNPALTKQYDGGLEDDPPWLPLGPKFRLQDGVKRFAKGYLAYAGSGPKSRSNQFIVALQSNGPLGGGSPWEVPWGELVGRHSYDTLSMIYTGYGEHGPGQGLLRRKGITSQEETDFSELDYIMACRVVDQETQETT